MAVKKDRRSFFRDATLVSAGAFGGDQFRLCVPLLGSRMSIGELRFCVLNCGNCIVPVNGL